MQPTDNLRGWPAQHAVQPYAAVLPTATPTQTDQPAENTIENMFSIFQTATRGFFGELEVSAAYTFNTVTAAFNNFLFEQPSLLILSADMIHTIFTHMTNMDLLVFTGTCITLHDMRPLPEIKRRIPKITAFTVSPFFGMILDQKGTKLILAANKRPLNHSENIAAEIPRLTLGDEEQIQAELKVINLETEFYDLFKERCVQLNIKPGSLKFVDCSANVLKNLSKKPESLGIVSDCMSIKLKTITNNFCGKVFYDTVDTYAKQPIANLTPDYFKAKVAALQAFFPMNPIAPIEAALRRAIRTPANSAEMKMLAAGYSDPTSPKFVELKQALKAELQLCKVETQARIGKLCGSGFNGTIHKAYCVMTKAEAQLGAELAECQRAFGAFPGAGSPLATLLGIDMTDYCPHQLQAARADLVARNDAFNAAKAEYNKLCAELNTLAVWTFGNITGGAIFEIETKLGNFDLFAQSEATKLANFYAELSQEVLPGKENASSAALHDSIG